MQCNECHEHTNTNIQDDVYFYTYETVDLPIVFKDPSVLEGYNDIMISMRHMNTGRQLDLDASEHCDIDTETGELLLHLTQEQTSKFPEGVVEVQVNILYDDDERDVSEKVKIHVYDNLHKKAMTRK